MRIEVTEDDILEGVRNDGSSCPVAKAMVRATGDNWRVGPYVAEMRDGRGRLLGDTYLPAEVGRFIYQFDHGETVRPFGFEVYIPVAKP